MPVYVVPDAVLPQEGQLSRFDWRTGQLLDLISGQAQAAGHSSTLSVRRPAASGITPARPGRPRLRPHCDGETLPFGSWALFPPAVDFSAEPALMTLHPGCACGSAGRASNPSRDGCQMSSQFRNRSHSRTLKCNYSCGDASSFDSSILANAFWIALSRGSPSRICSP